MCGGVHAQNVAGGGGKRFSSKVRMGVFEGCVNRTISGLKDGGPALGGGDGVGLGVLVGARVGIRTFPCSG
jgi:hypothetical protein